jgi:cytochrome c553
MLAAESMGGDAVTLPLRAALPADERGRVLEIVLLCAGCDGMAGEGRPEAGYPGLRGQPPGYLERQLEAYACGDRVTGARPTSPA